jgi:hypothetical protein
MLRRVDAITADIATVQDRIDSRLGELAPVVARLDAIPGLGPVTAQMILAEIDHARGLKPDLIAHLGTLDFVTAKENVLLLGPPGTGKTHLATGWRSAPARPATGCTSPPPPRGSAGWPRPIMPAGCMTNYDGWAAIRCWSSTRSATCPSNPRRPTCSSS